MTQSYKTSKSDSLSNLELTNPSNFEHDQNHEHKVCEQLKNREQQWWQARQRLIDLKERQVFWFGDNSGMMWLLWQLVSYVVMGLLLMLATKMFEISFSLKQYILIFALQTLVFIVAFVFKGNLANLLQNKIKTAELQRDQCLNEMIILASDSLFPRVYAQAPLSLQTIYESNQRQIRLVSLHALLTHEINAGRLILQHQTQANLLPLELAEDELNHLAFEMIYRSAIA